MICPNCGKECSEEEIFCRQCGTKIRASKPNNTYNNDVYDKNDLSSIIETPSREEVEELESILQRDLKANNADANSLEEPEAIGHLDEEDMGVIEADHKDAGKTYSSKSFSEAPSLPGKRKKKNKKVAIIITVLAVLAAIIGTVLFKYFTMTADFDKYYKAGQVYYNDKNYQDARTQFLNAAQNAFTSGQKIKAYNMVYNSDDNIGGYEKEEISYLEALIDLDDSNVEYYKDLIILYQNNDMESKIDTLISDAPSSVQEKLKDFDGTIPVTDVPAGKFDKPITVNLTATSGVTIYYTLDGSRVEDSPSRKKYIKPIVFDDEDSYTLRAASKDKKGKFSKELKVKYDIDFGKVNPPSVNLDSGKYSEQKKIEVSCDDNCTIYYTKDGTTPTKSSKKYKKAIKLPKGTSLYYFIACNEDGIFSEVVTRAYEYAPTYSYSYDDALTALSSTLVSSGKFEDENGTFKNGDVGYLNYKSTEEINGSFHYIVQMEIEDKKGKTKSTEYYAVSTDSGDINKASRSGGKYKFK